MWVSGYYVKGETLSGNDKNQEGQAYLGDSVVLVTDHQNTVNVAIKHVKLLFFVFQCIEKLYAAL